MNNQHLLPRLTLPIPTQCQRASGCWFLHIRWHSQDRFCHCRVHHSPLGHSAAFTFSAVCANSLHCTHGHLHSYSTQVTENRVSDRLPSTLCAHTAVDTHREQAVPCRHNRYKHTQVQGHVQYCCYRKKRTLTLTTIHTRITDKDNTPSGLQCSH